MKQGLSIFHKIYESLKQELKDKINEQNKDNEALNNVLTELHDMKLDINIYAIQEKENNALSATSIDIDQLAEIDSEIQTIKDKIATAQSKVNSYNIQNLKERLNEMTEIVKILGADDESQEKLTTKKNEFEKLENDFESIKQKVSEAGKIINVLNQLKLKLEIKKNQINADKVLEAERAAAAAAAEAAAEEEERKAAEAAAEAADVKEEQQRKEDDRKNKEDEIKRKKNDNIQIILSLFKTIQPSDIDTHTQNVDAALCDARETLKPAKKKSKRKW